MSASCYDRVRSDSANRELFLSFRSLQDIKGHIEKYDATPNEDPVYLAVGRLIKATEKEENESVKLFINGNATECGIYSVSALAGEPAIGLIADSVTLSNTGMSCFSVVAFLLKIRNDISQSRFIETAFGFGGTVLSPEQTSVWTHVAQAVGSRREIDPAFFDAKGQNYSSMTGVVVTPVSDLPESVVNFQSALGTDRELEVLAWADRKGDDFGAVFPLRVAENGNQGSLASQRYVVISNVVLENSAGWSEVSGAANADPISASKIGVFKSLDGDIVSVDDIANFDGTAELLFEATEYRRFLEDFSDELESVQGFESDLFFAGVGLTENR